MNTLLVLAACACACSLGGIAAAADRCSCIANGQRIAEGKTACIRPASGEPFLARCEIVLNNTSWRKLQDGCPSAGADGNGDRLLLLARPS